MNKRKDFKTSDLRDIINYASNMEHIDQVMIDYEDKNNGVWNIAYNLFNTNGINMVAMINNALRNLYNTYPIKSYIMERNDTALYITLYC